jgi:cephalosporin-C deacetylase-like acetyl esterase
MNGTKLKKRHGKFAKIASFWLIFLGIVTFFELNPAKCWAQAPSQTQEQPSFAPPSAERRVSSPPPIETSWSDLTAGIESPEQWSQHKAVLRSRFLELIRDQYKPQKPPLDLQVHEEVEVDGLYVRKLVSYAVESDERAHAYLAIPLDRKEPGSAIVALHGTYPKGKEQAAGLEPDKTRAHLDHLARRGFVVIAPDHFVAGERIPAEGAYDTTRFHQRHPEWTAVGKFTYEHSIAIDVLQTLPQVDSARIGVMGHSLGGQGAIFLAAYDERVKAAACNCAASFFRYNDAVKEWSRDRWYVYFKHIRPGLLEGKLPPIDFHEIMALIAPRALLDISAINDGVEATQRQRVLMNMEVMKAFELEHASDRFAFFVHGKKHSVPEESRELIASWLKSQLHESPSEKP